MNRIDEFTKENVKDIWVWCKVMNDRLAEVNGKLDLLLKLAKVEESHRSLEGVMDNFTREEQRRMFGSLADFYSKHGKLPQEMIHGMAGDPECAWEIAHMYAALLTEISREMIAEGQAALGRNPPVPDRERT